MWGENSNHKLGISKKIKNPYINDPIKISRTLFDNQPLIQIVLGNFLICYKSGKEWITH